MADTDLVLLAYASTAKRRASKEELIDLLLEARAKNVRLGISGMLLYVDGAYFQILEGPRGTVEGLFATIAADPRHRAVVKLIVEPIEVRSFASWSMGYADISRADLSAIPGLSDFFLGGSSLLELEGVRARKLLAAFKEGLWRGRLSDR
jgi:hypothetical protein